MSYNESLDALTRVEREALEQRLDAIDTIAPTGQQIRRNLFAEAHLPSGRFKALLREMAGAPAGGPALKGAFIEACRRHKLKAGSITRSHRPSRLGRAVGEDAFYAVSSRHAHGYFAAKSFARANVRRLMRRLPSEDRHLAEMPLGYFVMWATFDEDDDDRDPFLKFHDDPDSIREHLGLDREEFGKKLLLFVYEPRGTIALRYPTVTDAEWHYYFSPSPKSAPAGRTLPHRDGLESQPEVVHIPEHAGRLQECPRVV